MSKKFLRWFRRTKTFEAWIKRLKSFDNQLVKDNSLQYWTRQDHRNYWIEHKGQYETDQSHT